jgi:hypothetical protein
VCVRSSGLTHDRGYHSEGSRCVRCPIERCDWRCGVERARAAYCPRLTHASCGCAVQARSAAGCHWLVGCGCAGWRCPSASSRARACGVKRTGVPAFRPSAFLRDDEGVDRVSPADRPIGWPPPPAPALHAIGASHLQSLIRARGLGLRVGGRRASRAASRAGVDSSFLSGRKFS